MVDYKNSLFLGQEMVIIFVRYPTIVTTRKSTVFLASVHILARPYLTVPPNAWPGSAAAFIYDYFLLHKPSLALCYAVCLILLYSLCNVLILSVANIYSTILFMMHLQELLQKTLHLGLETLCR